MEVKRTNDEHVICLSPKQKTPWKTEKAIPSKEGLRMRNKCITHNRKRYNTQRDGQENEGVEGGMQNNGNGKVR